MKYLKSYESIDKPEVGDYVICNPVVIEDFMPNTIKIQNIMLNNIGILKEIEDIHYKILYPKEIFKEIVSLNDISEFTIEDNYILIYNDEVEHFSKNKEELNKIIRINKYNL